MRNGGSVWCPMCVQAPNCKHRRGLLSLAILMLSGNRKFSHAKLLIRVIGRAKIWRTEWKEAHKVLDKKSVGARSSSESKTTHHERHAWLFKAFAHLNGLVSVEMSVKFNAPTGPGLFITWRKFPGVVRGSLPLSFCSPVRTVIRGAVS